jgi:hypothetical protein
MKKKSITVSFIIFSISTLCAVPQSDELIVLQYATTAQMNALGSTQQGTLIFNTDDHEVYERNATSWKRISSDGSETKIVSGNGTYITGSGTTSDPYQIHISTPYDCGQGAQTFASCSAVNTSSNGVYCIDHDGPGGDVPYEVYCDMTTDGGGWYRVVRTTGNNHQFGQRDDNIVYAAVSDTVGIYVTYKNVKNFSKVMLKKVGTSDYASYDLVSTVSGESIYDLMKYVKNQPMHIQDDSAFDGARVKGLTSEYSGIKTSGTLNYNYFFMAGINESYDNDQAYMSFSDSTGSNNNWGDHWRKTSQAGTIWSLLNGDYYTNNNYHIGNGYSQAGAGYKGNNDGTYEVYIK